MKLRSGEPEEAGMSAAHIRRVAELAESWVAQGVTPALVVLVARRGMIVLHEAFGRLTPAPDAPPLQRDTIYPLASLTKPITATAAMILVEDGLLGLNRPVAEYIPEFVGVGKEAVLVHHLLTHTSGLRDEDVFAHCEQKYGSVVIPAATTQHPRVNEYLFLGYDTPLWKPPGTEMAYCDYGYELLGEIVQRISGQALSAFAQARIFAPLAMQDTYYLLPAVLRRRVVRRPPDAPFAGPASPGLVNLPPLFKSLFPGLDTPEWQESPFACAGLFSTALDMASFGQMVLNRGGYGEARILSPATVAAMTCNQIPGIGSHKDGEFFPEASWGLGWDIHSQKKATYDGTLYSAQAFSHSGGGGVQLWVDPVYELVGVYFSVVLRTTDDGLHPVWPVDLFMNAVTAAVIDE